MTNYEVVYRAENDEYMLALVSADNVINACCAAAIAHTDGDISRVESVNNMDIPSEIFNPGGEE